MSIFNNLKILIDNINNSKIININAINLQRDPIDMI